MMPEPISKLIELDAYVHLGEILNELRKDKPGFDEARGIENGGRKSGKTTNAINLGVVATLMFAGDCDFMGWRYFINDAKELFAEVKSNYERVLGRELTRNEVNESNRTIKVNGNIAKVWGVNSGSKRKTIKKSGIWRARGKKALIVLIDERHEFTDDDIVSLRHALGGYRHVVMIDCLNPHSVAIPIVNRAIKRFPQNEMILKDKGEQFKFWRRETTIDFGNEGTRHGIVWEWIHYTNWRVNTFLSNADILSIIDTWQVSPQRAKVADYGMAGTEIGAIYGYERQFAISMPVSEIMRQYGNDMDAVSVGVDFGESEAETGSATAMSLWAKERTTEHNVGREKWYLLWLYRHHNANGYKTNQMRAAEMITGLADMLKRFPRLPAIVTSQGGLVINAEWNGAYQELLGAELAKRGLGNYISITPAMKYKTISRILVRRKKLTDKAYYVATEAEYHLHELDVQTWDELKIDRKTGLPIPVEAYNDTTDASDYATTEWFTAVYNVVESKVKGLTKH